MTCGKLPDGCGGSIDCGGCPTGLACGGGGMPNECGQLPAKLLYVSPSSPTLANLSAASIDALNQSPYDAFAFPVAGPNDATLPSAAELTSAEGLLQSTSKQAWPWVYLNRMVGKVPASCQGTCCTGTCPGGAPCQTITGIDIYDAMGGETALVAAMTAAAQFAVATNAAGIVFDTEPYSDECMATVADAATALGKPVLDVTNHFIELGGKIADALGQVSPSLVVLMTGLSADTTTGEANIGLGIMARTMAQRYGLTVLDGGKDTVGFLHASLDELNGKLAAQAQAMAPWITQFNFAIATTLAPYVDVTMTSGFIASWYQANQAAVMTHTLSDLEPLMAASFEQRPAVVWFYGAPEAGPTMAGYTEYDPMVASQYDAVVARARSDAAQYAASKTADAGP